MTFSKTPLAGAVRRAFLKAVLPSSAHFDLSRRKFLKRSAQGGALAMVGGFLPAMPDLLPPQLENKGRIAIVGSGLAGLTAAYYLRRKGIRAELFEASSRVGGRIYTGQNVVGPGLYTELGGEFIDSNHRDMHRLIRWLGLELIDTYRLSKGKESVLFFLDGRPRSEQEVVEAFLPFGSRIVRDAAVLPEVINYQTPAGSVPLDRLSIAAYLRRLGVGGWLYQLIDVAYTSEMGISIEEQSALNFVEFISPGFKGNRFELFGDSDERYKIVGGNQRLVDELAARLEGQVRLDRSLSRLVQKPGGAYTLHFSNGEVVEADVVVLTIPFTKLRGVELAVELPPLKKQAIAELSYGTNSKAFMGFSQRVWERQGHVGYLIHPLVQNGWDSTQGQPGPAGGYSLFLGGQAGLDLTPKPETRFLPPLEEVFPGMSASFNGRSDIFHWPSHPFTEGSYASYSVGQRTRFGGIEGEPVGMLFFAGEHCSTNFQGFMNGAAETGRKAAEAILKKVRV